MKTKQVWANLAVKNVEQTRKFYSDLGFKANEGRQSAELASFLVGEANFVLHFFAEDSSQFQKSINGKIADLKQGNEVMFTLSAHSRHEVDECAEAVKAAGGTVFSEPQTIMNDSWYGCGFADPDGHKWNVFYNGK